MKPFRRGHCANGANENAAEKRLQNGVKIGQSNINVYEMCR